jgi:sortase A
VSAFPFAIRVPADRRRRARPPVAVVIGAASVVAALVLSFVGSNVWASIRQQGLERRFDAAVAKWSALDPVERSAITYAPGAPVARLEISSIGLDTIVVEGTTPQLMRGAPGHLVSSVTPGEEGIAIVTGNRMGFGSFFLRIDRLSQGDRIVTSSAQGRTVYAVESVRLIPTDQLDLTVDSTRRVLVLFGSGRLWGGPDRIVVRAVAEEGAA